MKTLYEILEVSENASKEVIEKAYKVLAKKYHPDLQEERDKPNAENQMKEINEAYSVLSDETSRKKYDEELQYKKQQEEQKKYDEFIDKGKNNLQSEEQEYKNTNYSKGLNNEQEVNQNLTAEQIMELKKRQEEMLRQQQEEYTKMQQEQQKRYNDAYYKYLKSLGYKIRYKWTWKQYLILLIVIAVVILLGFILWIIPPTHDWMVAVYNDNIIVKVLANIFIGFFNGIGNIIYSIFH